MLRYIYLVLRQPISFLSDEPLISRFGVSWISTIAKTLSVMSSSLSALPQELKLLESILFEMSGPGVISGVGFVEVSSHSVVEPSLSRKAIISDQ